MSIRSVSDRRTRAFFATATIAVAVASLSACTIVEEDRIDYKSARTGRSLEVPPDLTQLTRESRYAMPGDSVSAAGMQVGSAASAGDSATARAKVGDVRIERAGTQRWLVVDRPADQLWDPVRQFWQDNGFTLAIDQSQLGIMETDWAENRAKIPQDVIRRTLGKLIDNVYDTGIRDRFRTRLERTADGKTEIYISHRGMEEVYTSARQEQTVWQPRASDPELETEFLRRLMVRLGVSEDQSKAVTTAAKPAAAAVKPVTVDNQQGLQLEDGFDRAWRRVGLSLDRSGFTVEDRDRTKGIYFVRWVPALSAEESKKPGLLSRMFGARAKEAQPERYQVVVRSTSGGNATTVTVLNSQGQIDNGENTQKILKVLAEDLR